MVDLTSGIGFSAGGTTSLVRRAESAAAGSTEAGGSARGVAVVTGVEGVPLVFGTAGVIVLDGEGVGRAAVLPTTGPRRAPGGT